MKFAYYKIPMNKLIVALAISSLSAYSIDARTLSPDEALARAFAGNPSVMKAPSTSALSLEFTETRPDSDEPGVYIFGKSGGGFYVLSADDTAVPLLGYSEDGSFSADNIPPAMRWWLSEYASQISNAKGSDNLTFKAARAQRAEIAPLVKTVWNQGAPFNRKCPLLGSQRAVTGCVATALAQVMNYHEYPTTGTGSNSYTLDYNNTTVSLDFSKQTFDWANMADNYNGHYTIKQANAVAELMYACGVAVNIQYTPSESGAQSFAVAEALNKYFGYDQSVVCLDRQYYSAAEWEELVYNQLKEYGPVQYSGSNSSVGHSFVCDGYRSDGYFHINWGWGGMSDGYFLLYALDPDQQGIGGSTAGYNSWQDIIANVSRPRSGSKATVNLVCPSGFSFEKSTITLGGVATMTGPIFNMGSKDLSGYIGVRMVNDATGAVFYAENPYRADLPVRSGFSSFSFYMPDKLTAGTYTVSPGFRTDDIQWAETKTNISYPQAMRMTVSGKTATFTTMTGAELSSTDFSLDTQLYLGSPFKTSATITNNGKTEFYGDILPALLSGSDIVALGEQAAISIAAGASATLDYTGSLSLFAEGKQPSPGNYTMCLVRGNDYKIISNVINVVLRTATGASLQVSDFSVIGNTSAINPESVNIRADIKCTSGYFGGALTAVIFDSVSGIGLCQSNRTCFINSGESQTLYWNMAIPSPEAGKRYLVGIYRGQNLISGKYIDFTTAASGIDNISTAKIAPYPNPTDGIVNFGIGAPCDGAVYTIGGALAARVSAGDTAVDLTALQAGIYILRLGSDIYRIIRK